MAVIKYRICGDDEIVHYTLQKFEITKDEYEKNKEKPQYFEKDGLYYTTLEKRKGVYIPVASFITSYAREKTIRTSQAITDYSIEKYGTNKYVYSDTDSIYSLLDKEELKQFVEIDKYKLGAWSIDGEYKRGRFIRQKTYVLDKNGKLKITCAGMPSQCYDHVTWENFYNGFTCGGKLTYKHVKGGVILTETEFTIKGAV